MSACPDALSHHICLVRPACPENRGARDSFIHSTQTRWFIKTAFACTIAHPRDIVRNAANRVVGFFVLENHEWHFNPPTRTTGYSDNESHSLSTRNTFTVLHLLLSTKAQSLSVIHVDNEMRLFNIFQNVHSSTSQDMSSRETAPR